MPKFDIVVVGAGNAGMSAALQCQLLGLKTLLIEKHNLPLFAHFKLVVLSYNFNATIFINTIKQKP